MALLPRAQIFRIFGLALRSRAVAVRPAALEWALRWRNLATASFPAWNNGQRLHNYRPPHLSLAAGRSVVPIRGSASEGLSSQELEDRVLNVLKLFDKVNPEKVTLEAHFMKDLGMDSLDAVEVVMAFEDEFGVEISDEEAEKIFSCKDAIELLKSKLDVH